MKKSLFFNLFTLFQSFVEPSNVKRGDRVRRIKMAERRKVTFSHTKRKTWKKLAMHIPRFSGF